MTDRAIHSVRATEISPTIAAERRILTAADRVRTDLTEQGGRWKQGFTRRSFLAGSGMVATAALGAQLVTIRHAYAAPLTGNGKTLVVVFMRGALDGLATVVPRNNPGFAALRPQIGIPDSQLLGLDDTFGLHPSLQAMYPLWQRGQLGFVHAVGSRDSNRDHFGAQALMERGTSNLTSTTGWLDRVLEEDGPGTTFRAVCEGPTVAESLMASADAVAMKGIDSLSFNNPSPNVSAALRSLFTGLDNPVEGLMERTLLAVADSASIKATAKAPQNGAVYTQNAFGDAMADVVRLVRANCGLRVVTVDVGGWDVHSAAGTVAAGTMTYHLKELATTMSAFSTDLGARMSDVTVVLMSEFGRRVEQNGNGGTDHGFGGLMMLLGGNVRGGLVHGGWPGVRPQDLVNGDLGISNDYRDVLGEVAQKTLNLGSVSSLFPGHLVAPLTVMR